MAAVSSLSPQYPYSRRVSFNNIRPEDFNVNQSDTNGFSSYSMAQKEPSQKTHEPDLSRLFGNYSLTTGRRKSKLPDPPSKSILKNKLSPEQLRSNLAHAKNMGAAFNDVLNELVDNPSTHVPKSELARVVKDPNYPESEESTSSDEDDVSAPDLVPSFRKKSFSGMTNEELMALDPQFSKPKSSDLNSFKFDSVGPVFSSSRRSSHATSQFTSSRAKQVLYPSSNENNYRSVSLTVKHEDFDHMHAYPRTILSVISGRRHSWNSLDWLLLTEPTLKNTPSFLQDGDYLVIAGLVPLKFLQTECKGGARKKTAAETKIFQKCEKVLKYILDNLPDPALRLKITVELVIDKPPPDPMTLTSNATKKSHKVGTKFMLSHVFKQYHPMIVVVGNRSTNLNFKYPIRIKKNSITGNTQRSSISAASGLSKSDVEVDEYLIKLASYLVRYSTVPVIMAGNSTIFHQKPKPKIQSSVTFSNNEAKSRAMQDSSSGSTRKGSSGSENSIMSYGGEEEVDSAEDQLPVNGRQQSQVNIEDRFSTMMSDISQKSLTESYQYLEFIKADKLSPQIMRSKVHDAYISMDSSRRGSLSKTVSSSSGGKAYKVKSLISYSEEDEKKNEKMINDKKSKNSAPRSSMTSSNSKVSNGKKVKKKKSILQKIGLKKGA